MNTSMHQYGHIRIKTLIRLGRQLLNSIHKIAVQLLCLSGLLLSTLLTPSPVLAETAGTQVGGPIFGNTTWSAAASPYIVSSNVQVMKDATLTIEPGVTVRFATDKALVINGQLLARGRADAPILFTRDTPVVANWGYLKFEDSSTDATFDSNGVYTGGSILQYVTVEFAGGVENNPAAIVVSASSPYFDYITVHDSARVGIAMSSSNTRITNSTVSENKGDGISLNDSAGRVTNSMISKNGGIGVKNIPGSGSGPTAIASNIVNDNGGSGIILSYGQSNGITEKNIVYNNNGNGIECGSATVRDNAIYRNSGSGIFGTGGCLITRNIVAYNLSGGIYSNAWDEITHNKVAENTSGNSGRPGGIVGAYETIGYNLIVFNHTENNSSNSLGACSGVYGEFIYNTIVGQTLATESMIGGVIFGDGTITCPFHHNNIYANQGYDFYNGNSQTSGTLDARFNYWGTTDSNLIHPEIYDFIDDASKASTNYGDFLLEPDTTAPPAPPTGLQVTVNNGVFTLQWDANREADIVGYRVYYDTDSGYPYEGTGAIQGASGIDVGNVTTYNLSGFPANTDIYFTVLAYDNSGDAWDGTSWYAPAVKSNPGDVTPLPTTPAVTITPTTPAPVTPVPTTPTVTITPNTPAPVTPVPTTPTVTVTPTTPAPVTPVPTTPTVTVTPTTPAPVTPVPVPTTPAPEPSLKVDLFAYPDELWVNPAAPRAGETAQVSLIVHMQNGRTVLQNVKVAFYLQTQDTLLGQGMVPFIDPPDESESTMESNVVFPNNGNITLIAVIDPDNQIDEGEAGEENNVITRTISIVPPQPDQTEPVITKLQINNGASETVSQTAKVEVAATDPQPNPSGVKAASLIEYVYDIVHARWMPVQMSDWLNYADPSISENWTLYSTAGMHYIQGRGLDNALNISVGNARTLINYIPASDTIAQGEVRIYRQEVSAGQQLEVTVEPILGDPDLYVWSSRIDQSAWVSNQEGSAIETVRIPATQIAPGIYQFEIYGITQTQYRLYIHVMDGNALSNASESTLMTLVTSKPIHTAPIVPVSSIPSINQGPLPPILSFSETVFLPFLSR